MCWLRCNFLQLFLLLQQKRSFVSRLKFHGIPRTAARFFEVIISILKLLFLVFCFGGLNMGLSFENGANNLSQTRKSSNIMIFFVRHSPRTMGSAGRKLLIALLHYSYGN